MTPPHTHTHTHSRSAENIFGRERERSEIGAGTVCTLPLTRVQFICYRTVTVKRQGQKYGSALSLSLSPLSPPTQRCSSQTYFPSCEIPRNTDSEIWPQRFNLFFNLSEDFDSKLDVINATLRLYKNNSLSLEWPKTLLIRAFVYTRSLTRRRSKYP